MGPQRADLLKKELSIYTFEDLLSYYPFRHIDKSAIVPIAHINFETEYAQIAAVLLSYEIIGTGKIKRLVAEVEDKSGTLELVWFQGINWVQKTLQIGSPYLIFGRCTIFNNKVQMSHPEMEPIITDAPQVRNALEPVYSTTEKLKARGLGAKQLSKLTEVLFKSIGEKDLPENLPVTLLGPLQLISRYQAIAQIHFPETKEQYAEAVRRLKLEELFLAQLRMGLLRMRRHKQSQGVIFGKVGSYFNDFYKNHLPFELTNAQKKVIKEIRSDTATGKQMNRLLQGDVGSGKTIVALLIMLLAADNDYQSCLMAPTEILAQQHFETLSVLLMPTGIKLALLTGSTKAAERKRILQSLKENELSILIGTHAVIEDKVQFHKLGMVVIDEQHRFGVAQRAKLWEKASLPPHILVMTATPIPRTLAMTVYGDLDYSVIDELPPGRKQIKTVHRYETQRSAVMDFIKAELTKGRQAYIIFPLIEESEKLDYENLMEGYERIKTYFPEPQYWISMVHGRQPAAQKDMNMQRFATNDTQLMVATTVVEVGVNIPNATVMVIENSEKFGLSQLHQLRGRVGRGAEQSYCILLSGSKLGKDARERIRIMTATNNGFEIAEKDLQLRGPGEIEGTRQSGALNFKLASIVDDKELLLTARRYAEKILEEDQKLENPENTPLRVYLHTQKNKTAWSRIS